MRNAGLDKAQAGIKIAGRNIHNFRYADDTTLMAESEEELKSLLMKVKVKSLSRVWLFETPWIIYILPGFSVHGIFQARVLEWVAISSPGDLPNPGIEPGSPALQADALPSEPPGKLFTF